MNLKDSSREVSEGKKQFVSGHWMTSDLYYKVAESSGELSSRCCVKFITYKF